MWALLKLSQQPNFRHLHRTVALREKRIYPGPMTQLRCTLIALLGLTLAACGDDKTVVSVNYSYGTGIEGMESVHVLITQGGQKFETTFETPLVPATEPNKLPDGGDGTGMVDIMIPDTSFFQRYDLEGFKDGEAALKVDLLSPSGDVLFTEETTFDVRENGAVAAYAEFEIEPPPAETSGSTSDTAAASSAAPTDAGSDSGTAPTSAPDASTSAPDAATSATDSGTTVEAGTTGATGASDAATSASDASATDGG